MVSAMTTSSKRLKYLSSLVSHNKSVIWDLCCDHGLIGESFIRKENIREVHFVDCVPHIVDKLEKRMTATSSDFKCCYYALDAAKTPIYNSNLESVIIAGIGGYKLMDILSAMIEKYEYLKPEFIISAHKNWDKVKNFLVTNNFEILEESVVEDRSKRYPIIKCQMKES